MKVLMVEPGKSPYETEIEGGWNPCRLLSAEIFRQLIPLMIWLG